jgi:NAD(P)-dependent dehydrogenase (short-subunit alcohol dehydrogenase family)
MRFGYDFSTRRALITGASSGLGAHFALLLARQGIAGLALAARRRDRLDETAAACRAAGAGVVVTLSLDVTEDEDITKAIADTAELLGGLDLLINNAGVADSARALDTDASSFDRVMDTNLRGPWLMAVGAAKAMIAAGTGGDIVNIASILGLRVKTGVAPYAVSKAGVIQMTRALATEWARHDIRVNALAPGYIETDINRAFFAREAGQAMIKGIPARRIGQAGDLDAPFLLLCSGASAYLTGAVLTVDGGHHINSL